MRLFLLSLLGTPFKRIAFIVPNEAQPEPEFPLTMSCRVQRHGCMIPKSVQLLKPSMRKGKHWPLTSLLIM